VDSEARIRRMEEAGSITAKQADLLRDSLAGAPAGPEPSARRRWPVAWIVGALCVAALVALVVAGTGAPPEPPQNVAETLNQPGVVGAMSRSLSAVLAGALLLVVPLLIWMWLHNGLIAKEEAVYESWAQTESNYQRRADLIPALVETVTRYLRHEGETLTSVTAERARAAESLAGAVEALIESNKQAGDVQSERGRDILEDEDALRRLYAARAAVGQRMQGVIAVAEGYPELRSADQFLELQAQLEGTENRINVARMRFNEAVRDYNAAIRKLPGSLIAAVGNFRRKAYFEAEESSASAPELQLD
jgi:LemA protein